MNLTLHSIGLPVIDRIGRYPLVNPVFEFSYRNPTHTVHLYDYSARIRIDGEEYSIEPGDLTCIHRGTSYSYASEQPGDHWCIHFHDDENEEGARLKFPPILRPGANAFLFRGQMKHMCSLFNARGRDYEVELMRAETRYRLKAFLLSIYLQSWGHKAGARSEQSFDMDGLLAWLDDHLAEPLSVDRVARKAGASRTTLARHFRRKLGMTLNQYLLHKRIDRAKSLLITSNLPISEVGASVGIADPQYFNKQFRRVDGQSPTRHRESHKTFGDVVKS
jgi:AraC-like DNA-binding protein